MNTEKDRIKTKVNMTKLQAKYMKAFDTAKKDIIEKTE